MIRTRITTDKTGKEISIFYESTTGATIKNITAVRLEVVPNAVITVVYKAGIPYIYLPHKGMALVTLQDAIEKQNLVVELVG